MLRNDALTLRVCDPHARLLQHKSGEDVATAPDRSADNACSSIALAALHHQR